MASSTSISCKKSSCGPEIEVLNKGDIDKFLDEMAGPKNLVHFTTVEGAKGILLRSCHFLPRFLFSFITFVCLPAFAIADSGPSPLITGLRNPLGIAVDNDANIFVHSDAVFTTLLSKFDPTGVAKGQIQLGGITVDQFIGSHLARDPLTGAILLLTTHGVLYSINQISGTHNQILDLSAQEYSVDNSVYDVLLGKYQTLFIGNPTYGDFAAYRRSATTMDLFISANTGASGSFPFVMKVHLDQESSHYQADVIVTSTGTTAGSGNQPQGIGVNNDGMVLTGLPFLTTTSLGSALGTVNSLVAFDADFSQSANCPGASGCPRWVFTTSNGKPKDFDHLGMGTDSAGNFYLASGTVGTSACGLGAANALVVIPKDLNFSNSKCLQVLSPLGYNSDLAVSPSATSGQYGVYMTISSVSGGVIKFLVTPTPTPTPIPTPVINKTDVSVSQTSSTKLVALGGKLTYTTSIKNQGALPAYNLEVTETLYGVTLNSIPDGCTANGSSLTCSINSLGKGETKKLLLDVTPTFVGTLMNSATVSGGYLDTKSANNTSSAKVLSQAVDLVLAGKAPKNSRLNAKLQYSYTVKNASKPVATNVKLAVQMPHSSAFVSARGCSSDSSQQICTIGTLKSGQSKTVSLVVKPSGIARTLTNSASVSLTETDRKLNNNSVSTNVNVK